MKPNDPLQRLFHAAARVPRAVPATAPLAVQNGALAGWRRSRAEDEWMGFLPLFRRGLAFAVLLLLVSLAFSFRGLDEEPSDELGLLDSEIELEMTP